MLVDGCSDCFVDGTCPRLFEQYLRQVLQRGVHGVSVARSCGEGLRGLALEDLWVQLPRLASLLACLQGPRSGLLVNREQLRPGEHLHQPLQRLVDGQLLFTKSWTNNRDITTMFVKTLLSHIAVVGPMDYIADEAELKKMKMV